MERLPSRIFVVNYIRAYATVIGLAPEEAILRYEEVDKATPEPSPVVLERERRRRAWLALAVLLVVALRRGRVRGPGDEREGYPTPSRVEGDLWSVSSMRRWSSPRWTTGKPTGWSPS